MLLTIITNLSLRTKSLLKNSLIQTGVITLFQEWITVILPRKNSNIRLQAGITLQLLKGLSYDAKVQYEILQDESRNLYKEGSYYVRNLVNTSSTWVIRR